MAGQNEEALEYGQEALKIYRRLAQKYPDRYEPTYVASLNNYAVYLSDAGQYEEALKHNQESLVICRRLYQKNPDRYEPDYALSLNNYSSHLSAAGQNEEALKHNQEALEIHRRLAQKYPDRYEPVYAASLSNYSNRLSDAGQNDAALKHAQEALEIRQRLAQINPEQYEPDYAKSLNNYSYRLLDTGQYEEALKHARQALEIRHRLAARAPERFDDDRFGSVCSVYFIKWLCNHPDIKGDLPDLNFIPATIPIHRRILFLLFASFVKACRATEPTSRTETFKLVLSTWDDLSPVDKNRVRCYWLCAAAWSASFTPAVVADLDWQVTWHQYKDQRQGQLPYWMQEVAQRLAFNWPA